MEENNSAFVSLVLKESTLRVFRKAINVMKDMSVFLTFKTIDSNKLRLSAVDHFACGAMYVDVPVRTHNCDGVWINLISERLFQLSAALSKYKHNLLVVLHQNNCAMFLNPNTNKSVLPSVQFDNFAPLTNQFFAIHEPSYHFFEMVSLDLLQSLTSLSVGSPIVHLTFRACCMLELRNIHEHGQTRITKKLFSAKSSSDNVVCDNTSCAEDCECLLEEVYVIKFVKLLVNPLINSSQKFCWLGIPKKHTQPLVIKFLLANDTYQHYLIFPFVQLLQHETNAEHPQASIKMKE